MHLLEQVAQKAKQRAREAQESRPLMDVEATRVALAQWLEEVKLPPGSRSGGWESLIQTFPPTPEETEKTSGVRLRLALPLATRKNKYLIAILECLDQDSRGNYLISVFVNWKQPERQMQKLVEERYRGQFDDALRGRHTLWAQTFGDEELPSALNCCAKAILSNELVSHPETSLEAEKIRIASPRVAQFPKPADS